MQSIALTEESPTWTLDQIAGLVFGVGRLDCLLHPIYCYSSLAYVTTLNCCMRLIDTQGIMLASVLLATKVDVFIARAQRRDLGLCEECGGLNEPETCDNGKCPYKQKP